MGRCNNVAVPLPTKGTRAARILHYASASSQWFQYLPATFPHPNQSQGASRRDKAMPAAARMIHNRALSLIARILLRKKWYNCVLNSLKALEVE